MDRPIALLLVIPGRMEDEAVTALWDLDTLGVEVRPGEGDALTLLAFFRPEDGTGPGLVSRLRAMLPEAAVTETSLPNVDWVARFREEFRAFDAGGFRIEPAWDAHPTRGEMVLRVDPGRAFGTGTHETTRLCLLLLERVARRSPLGAVLDVGTGTGLLGIAARRLGAAPVLATDIDPEALDAARLHARLNAARLALARADGVRPFRSGCCDLLLANLTAPLLIQNAQAFRSVFRRRAILAGLLTVELPQVQDAFAEPGLTQQIETLGEWSGLLLERPS